MHILVKYPGQKLREQEIDGSLKSMQQIVEGYIETVSIERSSNIILICNEEGLLKDLPHNEVFGYDFRGTIFFCKREGENLISLSETDISYLKKMEITYC